MIGDAVHVLLSLPDSAIVPAESSGTSFTELIITVIAPPRPLEGNHVAPPSSDTS